MKSVDYKGAEPFIRMNLETVVPWLKAHYLIILPLAVNIFTSMLCRQSDFTWFSKLKKPKYTIEI